MSASLKYSIDRQLEQSADKLVLVGRVLDIQLELSALLMFAWLTALRILANIWGEVWLASRPMARYIWAVRS